MIIATYAIVFASFSLLLINLKAGHSPRGGRKKLSKYIPIRFPIDIENGSGRKFIPQLGQKRKFVWIFD